jgi:myosin protein heavy chain
VQLIAQMVLKYGCHDAVLETTATLDTVAELWRIDRVKFELALIRPLSLVGRECIMKHLDVKQAQSSLNTMCKAIYERCFLWIVKKINCMLAADREANNFVGVLDFPGFEDVESNSFEQLCINYTDEKLQDTFNQHMFKWEQVTRLFAVLPRLTRMIAGGVRQGTDRLDFHRL